MTPDRLRGRVAAANSTFAGGGPQLGEFEAGIVVSLKSAPVAVALGGAGAVIAALAVIHFVPGISRFRWGSHHRPLDATETRAGETRGAIHIDESGTDSI